MHYEVIKVDPTHALAFSQFIFFIISILSIQTKTNVSIIIGIKFGGH
jgi:hypothetical protein